MRPSKRQLLLLSWDLLILISGVYLSYFIRLGIYYPGFLNPYELFQEYTGATTFTILIHLFVYYVFDLYNPSNRYVFVQTLKRVIVAEFFTLLAVGAAYFFLPNWRFGRGILVIGSFYFVPLLTLWRVTYSGLFQEKEASRNALLVGAGESAEFFLEEMKKAPENPYNIVGIVDDVKKFGTTMDGVKVLGKTQDMGNLIAENKARTLIVSNRIRKNQNILARLVEQKLAGIEVIDVPNAYKKATKKLPLKYIDLGWIVDASGFGAVNHPVIQKIHRILDVALSLAGLSLTLPLTIPAVLLIKLTSRGPVFYCQTRAGLYEKPFEIIKFRTMVTDAEKSCGPVQASTCDPRVTFVGRILRRTRIDEVPQFWNVLVGDMSLIGPRPERPFFVEKYKKEIPFYSLRYSIKPGITGWAQVNYKYGNTEEDALEKLQYELYYIKEMSLGLDFSIVLKTIQTVILKTGS